MQGLYVLIIVIGHGFYSGDGAVTQEFTTLENCQDAGNKTMAMFKKENSVRSYFECVKK